MNTLYGKNKFNFFIRFLFFLIDFRTENEIDYGHRNGDNNEFERLKKITIDSIKLIGGGLFFYGVIVLGSISILFWPPIIDFILNANFKIYVLFLFFNFFLLEVLLNKLFFYSVLTLPFDLFIIKGILKKTYRINEFKKNSTMFCLGWLRIIVKTAISMLLLKIIIF